MVPAMRLLAALALAAIAAGQMDHSGHMGMGMTMPAADGPRPACVEDPTQANCTAFKLPHPVVQGDLMRLCKAMHFMPGCSVYKACRAAAPNADDAGPAPWTAAVGANPDVCRRLNLVATVCAHDMGMGRMAGCTANYNSMCAKGSVVPLCKSMPGLSELPTTKAVNQAVKELCTGKRTRPGCAQCLTAFDANKTYGECDLLATWGDICTGEPKLPQCANHTALCTKDKTWFFCSGSAAASSNKGWALLQEAAGTNMSAAAAAGTAAATAAMDASAAAAKSAAEVSSLNGGLMLALVAWLVVFAIPA